MGIEIKIDLARVHAKSPLVALADVTLRFSETDITIRRCAVFEKSGVPPWASLPRIPISREGKRIYAPMIELGPDLRRRVLEAVLAKFGREKENAARSRD